MKKNQKIEGNSTLVLASESSARQSILTELKLIFDVIAPDFSETAQPGVPPAEIALINAKGKAGSVAAKLAGQSEANVIVIGSDQRHPAVPAKMVNAEVVGNAQNPRQKLAFFVVAPGLQGLHSLDKGVLEQILGQFLMADQLINRCENAGFVAVH